MTATMKYLLIRNAGLAHVEAFTILGLSTARGEGDKIGQFGSGSKHGILTLMRHNLTPRIFIGEDEIVFSAHAAKMGEKDYTEVRYTFQGEQHKTGMCLDFGALDWDTVKMSIREFICNALDQGENIEECANVCDSVQAHPDETRIFIKMEGEVVDYWQKLREYFLHFEGLQDVEVTPANSKMARFYRRGVYVTQCGKEDEPAIFTYNFQEGRIDESRNMDGASLTKIAARLLMNGQDHLETIFKTFKGGIKRWEHQCGNSLYFAGISESYRVAKAAWGEVFGDLPFACGSALESALDKKGIKYASVPIGWEYLLSSAGVVNAEKLLSTVEKGGAIECEATPTAVETFKRVWGWIESVRLTQDKAFPEVKCFTCPMSGGEERFGAYRDGVVYLNVDYDTHEQTAMEELAHYITGAGDETRDFQDYAFRLATRLAKRAPSPQP